MPINADKFEGGIDARSAATAILDFLSRKGDEAFTAVEIEDALGMSWDTIWYTLNRLVKEDLIEKRILDGKAYFMISDDYEPGAEEDFV